MRSMLAVAASVTATTLRASVKGAAYDPNSCIYNPTICLLNQSCKWDPRNPTAYPPACVDIPANQTDCYRNPDTCDPITQWCELQDHTSWQEIDHGTRGKCVGYQTLCSSCQRTAADGVGGLHKYPGMTLWDYEEGNSPAGADSSGVSYDESSPSSSFFGKYIDRSTECDPNKAVCTGNVIPSLPATCVLKRAPYLKDRLSARTLKNWIQRMLRMGARTYGPDEPQPNNGVSASFQQDQGASRTEVHKGVNEIMQVLWPADALNESWPGTQVPLDSLDDKPLKCCHWKNYTDALSNFQSQRGRAEYRNPLAPLVSGQGNPDPCVWCEFDGAFNDENPTIWQIIHLVTFNLPETITEDQYNALRALPLWLREHLSCSLCRSHVQEHLIELGVPKSRDGSVWAWYFWRAHNYVNEQSEVTRCGSQSCNWGAFNNPAPQWACPGLYRYPWFVKFEDAVALWRIGYRPEVDDDDVVSSSPSPQDVATQRRLRR